MRPDDARPVQVSTTHAVIDASTPLFQLTLKVPQLPVYPAHASLRARSLLMNCERNMNNTRHDGRTKLVNLLTPRMIDIGSVIIFLVLIIVIVPIMRNEFNTDAVSYYRLAVYWGQGDVARAVSGYWGPLSSWIMTMARRVGVRNGSTASM